MAAWLSVIGVGADGLEGLGSVARRLVETAETVVGGDRHLAMLPDAHRAERLTWATPLSETVAAIAARRGRLVAVLATGDPMWFGIGVTLARAFAPEEMIVVPHLSAFSLAAARMAWPIAETETLTLHGRPLDTLALHLAPAARILALSEDGETPATVARYLTERGWGPSVLTVLEHLGGVAERRIAGQVERWSYPRAADLNTLAIDCRPGPNAVCWPRVPGLPDDAFAHDGQLTKREVRAATLAALGPQSGALLWDIGAGCGSIAIEWMRAARRACAIAIEREPSRLALIARNAATLGVPRLRMLEGSAPAAFAGLDNPDAIFIGGGLSTPGLIESAWQALRPGGRLVANAVTIEGEARLLACHSQFGGALVRIAVSRAEGLGAFQGWRPLMPVTQWIVTKP